MHRIVLLLLVLPLGLTASPAMAAGKGTPPPPPVLKRSPVVAEWFKHVNVKAGQIDTVYARLKNGKKPISGARLTAILSVGGKTLKTVRGTTTDKKGLAHASFHIPHQAAGRKLTVIASLRYHGATYAGRNALQVKR